ncbi:hypothetical protein ACFL5U_02575 [Candidatus Margulisiibacteriota bacterium]
MPERIGNQTTLKFARTDRLAEAGYHRFPLKFPCFGQDLFSDQARLPGGLEVPRWMVLAKFPLPETKSAYGDLWDNLDRAEAIHLSNRFGLCAEPTGKDLLPDGAKLAILSHIFGPAAARTGVAFTEQYETSSPSLLSRPGSTSHWTSTLVNAEFVLVGIVKKCGTHGLIQKLVALVTGKSFIEIRESEGLIDSFGIEDDTSRQGFRINGISLGALSLLLGFLTPVEIAGEGTEPAIYLGMDIGWRLKEHNYVVARLNSHTEFPKTFHVYFLNICGIEGLKITRADDGQPISGRLNELRVSLQDIAQRFIRTV